jgi:glycosyltransferase involved in cell wall biosynthesis
VKVLFILKKNFCYGFQTKNKKSSGLWNSTKFISDALMQSGIHAKLAEVIDNNCIDKEVSEFKPDMVILEALWVVPSKMHVLKKLHPKVKWSVHLHSNIPFLAMEGVAIEWMLKYAEQDVSIIANSKELYSALLKILNPEDLVYLPNVFGEKISDKELHDGQTINVGCFGAVRPMKNQLIQAIAAIGYAKQNRKNLRFHINSTRVETGGDPALKNLRALFSQAPHAQLVEHEWMEQHEFFNLLHTKIDLGLQVSLSETFNVVTANYVAAGCPVVVSKEIEWVDNSCKARDNDVDDIQEKIRSVIKNKRLVKRNQNYLIKYSKASLKKWIDWLAGNKKCH